MRLGQVLYRLRGEKGLSQEALAEAVGVSRQAVAKWESDQALPELPNLVVLADRLGTTMDRIVRLATGEDCAVTGPNPGGADADGTGLIPFLLRAKRATYAGHGAETAPSRPASHDLRHEEGGLLYLDSYLGGELFAGEEAIWRSGRPEWSLNYAGRVLAEGFSGDFLKESLSLVRPDLPYRGPELHASGEYAYHCSVRGDFGWFEGGEEIFLAGRRVYECRFHGGVIR